LPWKLRTGPERTILLVSASLLLLGGAVVLAALYTPLSWPCVWKGWTGLPCAGCGGTRSLVLILRGEWALAIRMNPGVVVGAGLLGGAVTYAVAVLCFRVEPLRPKWRGWVWLCSTVFALNWIYLLAVSRP